MGVCEPRGDEAVPFTSDPDKEECELEDEVDAEELSAGGIDAGIGNEFVAESSLAGDAGIE